MFPSPEVPVPICPCRYATNGVVPIWPSPYVPPSYVFPSLCAPVPMCSRPYMGPLFPSLYVPVPISSRPNMFPFPYVPVSMRQTGSSLCVPVPTFPCFNATKLVPVPMCPRPHMSRSLRHKQGRPYVCPHPCLSPSLYDKACPRPYVSPSQCDKSGRPYVSPSLNAPFFMRQG